MSRERLNVNIIRKNRLKLSSNWEWFSNLASDVPTVGSGVVFETHSGPGVENSFWTVLEPTNWRLVVFHEEVSVEIDVHRGARSAYTRDRQHWTLRSLLLVRLELNSLDRCPQLNIAHLGVIALALSPRCRARRGWRGSDLMIREKLHLLSLEHQLFWLFPFKTGISILSLLASLFYWTCCKLLQK